MTKPTSNNRSHELAAYLRVHREKVGLSQRDLAEILGYSTPQFISNWERDISVPPVAALKKLALLLKVPPDEIFDLVLEQRIIEITDSMKKKFAT